LWRRNSRPEIHFPHEYVKTSPYRLHVKTQPAIGKTLCGIHKLYPLQVQARQYTTSSREKCLRHVRHYRDPTFRQCDLDCLFSRSTIAHLRLQGQHMGRNHGGNRNQPPTSSVSTPARFELVARLRNIGAALPRRACKGQVTPRRVLQRNFRLLHGNHQEISELRNFRRSIAPRGRSPLTC
jgi:hypothetical protein